MSFVHIAPIDLQRAVDLESPKASSSLRTWMWAFVIFGVVAFCVGLASAPPELLWGAYYTNVVFWTGLACGTVMLGVIFQVVKARWSLPIRRLSEAGVSFLPWAYLAVLSTYFGKEYLFPWARTGGKPGTGMWMEPNFVYLRFAVLLGLLFFLFCRFVRMSLRGDVGMVRERTRHHNRWLGGTYDRLTHGWRGSQTEVVELQGKMSWNAPLIVVCYALIYSLFAFEMVMAMDEIFYATMFGGFVFIGNIYAGWASTGLLMIYLASRDSNFAKSISTQQFHDLGKLTFGFGILWTYLFFSHFLPIWYGNVPEETQWMILRTREYPWKGLGWMTLGMCFIIPFLTLLSRDVKKTPSLYKWSALIILIGLWCERYILIMPAISPNMIPFGIFEVSFFVAFFGAYVLSVTHFLERYPILPVSHAYARQELEGAH